jgi:tRNA-2-methylthio-N6-dimethylallyladenosine synthase
MNPPFRHGHRRRIAGRNTRQGAQLAKKLFIKTYGCQMNVYDSARMADVLAPLGYAQVEEAKDADMVILNTCHIREKAAEKVYSDLGRLRAFKEHKLNSGGEMLLAVAGCVAQAEGEEILHRAPFVDIVLGPQTYHRLPELIARATRAGDPGTGPRRGVVDTDFPAEPKFDFLPEPGLSGPSAFLSVQEGCDKFCTFCVVPYTRGAEYSRPVRDVLGEAKGLVLRGAREIVLLGQNVNAYHGEALSGSGEWGLGRLIGELAEIDGLARIRYTTSHPGDMDDDLFAAHRDVPQLMPFLHLPVQSGSARILAAMNRRYGPDDYRRAAEKLRTARADMALASDFIVGFPGESRSDFEDTLKLVDDIGFAQAYSFKFSARPGTPAAAMEVQIDEDEKAARLAELQELIARRQTLFNAKFVGLRVPVLFDRRGRKSDQWGGRSPHMQAVHVEAEGSLFGAIAEVEVQTATMSSMTGRVVDVPQPEGAAA